MRTLGKEKRDILVQRIKDAKKDQDQTKQKLQTTMESFQALTGFQGRLAGKVLQTSQLRLRERRIAGGQTSRQDSVHRPGEQRSV